MTGGHPAAALHDQFARCAVTDQRPPLLTQRVGRLEASVVGQIELEETVHRARNMAADRVQRFVLAAEAIRRAGIDQQPPGGRQIGPHRIGIGDRQHFAQWIGHGLQRTHRGVERTAVGLPGGQAAIEHRHVAMTDPAQHPPQPGSEHAAGVVIGHHPVRRRNAALTQQRNERFRCRQRVTAIAAGLGRRQVAIEMHEQRARNVAGTPGGFAGLRTGQIMSAIHHDHPGVRHRVGQGGRGNQCCTHAVASASQSRAAASSSNTVTSASTNT